MKPWILGVACTILLAIAALLALGGPASAPPEPAVGNQTKAVAPAPVAVPESDRIDVVELHASKQPAPKEAPPGISRPEEWTERTLSGTAWKGDAFDFAFGKDGTWYMAGRAASKWRVEGRRIKLFDDDGEVHYIDIHGTELHFEGKPVGYPVSREE